MRASTGGPWTLEVFRAQLFERSSNSKTNMRLAAFVWENLIDVSYMTTEEVAAATGVSQATVTRFCARVGFDGFSSFNRILQGLVKERVSAPGRLLYASRTTSGKVDCVAQTDIENILRVDRMIREGEFRRLVRRLAGPERLVLLGARASATLVPYAHYFLSKVRERVEAAIPGTALWETLASDNPEGTLVFAFVFPRYPRALVEQLAVLAKAGFAIVALTDRPASPAAQFAEQMFVIPVTTAASVFDSYAAPITFLNLLVRDLAQQRGDAATARLSAIEALDVRRGMYHPAAGEGPPSGHTPLS